MWIDTETYVGFDRRRVAAGFRWLNRRVRQLFWRPPATRQLVRQLQLMELSFADQATLARFRQLLSATAKIAAERGERDVSITLTGLNREMAGKSQWSASEKAVESLARALALL